MRRGKSPPALAVRPSGLSQLATTVEASGSAVLLVLLPSIPLLLTSLLTRGFFRSLEFMVGERSLAR